MEPEPETALVSHVNKVSGQDANLAGDCKFMVFESLIPRERIVLKITQKNNVHLFSEYRESKISMHLFSSISPAVFYY